MTCEKCKLDPDPRGPSACADYPAIQHIILALDKLDLAPAARAPAALMYRWMKSAEPRWARGGLKGPADASDKLIPWEPGCR